MKTIQTRRAPQRIKVKVTPDNGVNLHYHLKLYVAGQSPKSVNAIVNIKAICEEFLQGRYDLDVIDLYQQPQLATGDQIIALPMLVRMDPLPLRRIIGDLSNIERVLLSLDLPGKP